MISGYTKTSTTELWPLGSKFEAKICSRSLWLSLAFNENSKITKSITSAQISWKRWKIILSTVFRITAKLKMSENHVFRFFSRDSGTVHVKILTNSIQETTFPIYKRSIYIFNIKMHLSKCHLTSVYNLSLKNFNKILVKQEFNQTSYLQKLVLDCY